MKTSYPVRCSTFFLLFSSFLPAATQAGTPYFDARFRGFEATAQPGRVIVADITEDGFLDVVMNCQGGVGLMQGRSDGDLGPFVLWPTGARPYDIAVGDLNKDGHLDCVTVEQENQVSILFGNGDGTFQPRLVHETTVYPSAVGIGYLNHDGRLDIVFANYYAHTFSVMLQTLDGSFAAPIVSPSGGFVSELIVRDMDLDKRVDVVYYGNLGYAVVYGNGDGSFGTIDFWDPIEGPRGIAVGDLNEDHRPDLVVSHNPGVFVRLNGPLRTFGAPVSYSIGDGGNSITIEDATGDDNLDILACTNNKSSIALLPGFGNGTFSPYSLHLTGLFAQSIGVADLTHDGIADLVSSDLGGRAINLHEGNGNSTFGHVESYPTAATSFAMLLEDFNRDSRPDVIYSTGYGPMQTPRLWIRLMQANGTPGPLDYYNCDSEALSLVSSDFNNDAYPDLAAVFSDSKIWVWMNNGSGVLGSRIDLSIRLDLMVSGDFNEDGAADLLGLNSWEPSAPLNLIPGNGNGTFDAPIGMPAPASISTMITGDVNDDSHLDVIYTHYGYPGSVSVWLGNGTGQFSHNVTLPEGNQPNHTILADLNLDGCPDLVTSIGPDRKLAIYQGHCDGSFDTAILVAVGSNPQGIVSADLDGDPYPDLAVANNGGNSVSLLRGNGSFDFARTDLGAGTQPNVISAGDLKQLGKKDLVTLCLYDISILRNNGAATVGTEPPKVSTRPILRNAPNPFDTSTTLSFAMPQHGRLRITIHDLQGRTVRELTDQVLPAGEYKIVWDGKDQNGVSVVPGLYLARLDAPSTRVTQKMFHISRY